VGKSRIPECPLLRMLHSKIAAKFTNPATPLLCVSCQRLFELEQHQPTRVRIPALRQFDCVTIEKPLGKRVSKSLILIEPDQTRLA
jgi:hypothetical protein